MLKKHHHLSKSPHSGILLLRQLLERLSRPPVSQLPIYPYKSSRLLVYIESPHVLRISYKYLDQKTLWQCLVLTTLRSEKLFYKSSHKDLLSLSYPTSQLFNLVQISSRVSFMRLTLSSRIFSSDLGSPDHFNVGLVIVNNKLKEFSRDWISLLRPEGNTFINLLQQYLQLLEHPQPFNQKLNLYIKNSEQPGI